MSYFNQLKKIISQREQLSKKPSREVDFFLQEVLRFYSIAGTLKGLKRSDGEPLDLTDTASVDERYLSHILSRSLIENFFKIIYIFDDPIERNERYEMMLNSFKQSYLKLMNDDLILKHIKKKFQNPEPCWKSLKKKDLDLSSKLNKIENEHKHNGVKTLNYLYTIYRIASFDTHGQNLENIFTSVFGKKCNFPILKLDNGFDLMAYEYLVLFKELKKVGDI